VYVVNVVTQRACCELMIPQSMGSVIDPIFAGTAMDKAPKDTITGSRVDSLYTNQPQSVRCCTSHEGRNLIHDF
jgi:hypothetical protein